MIKRITALFITFIAAAAMLALTGICASAASSIRLSRTSVTLETGESCTIKLEGVTSGTIKWYNYDTSVCRYKNGRITAYGEGITYVAASYKGKLYKCIVTVTDSDSVIEDCNYSVNLAKGVSTQVSVSINSEDSLVVSNSDSDVLKIDSVKLKNGSVIISLTGKNNGSSVITLYKENDKSVVMKLLVNISDTDSFSGRLRSSESTADASDYADTVIALVNKEREAAGLDPLEKSDSLCSSAEIRAAELGTKFSHTRPDNTSCFTAIDISYRTCGENIAMGQRTPDEVMNSWMGSSGHKANILGSKYTKIGVAYDESNGGWVQIFTG